MDWLNQTSSFQSAPHLGVMEKVFGATLSYFDSRKRHRLTSTETCPHIQQVIDEMSDGAIHKFVPEILLPRSSTIRTPVQEIA